eukprot:4182400-Pyramimonas_sp.AAC.2
MRAAGSVRSSNAGCGRRLVKQGGLRAPSDQFKAGCGHCAITSSYDAGCGRRRISLRRAAGTARSRRHMMRAADTVRSSNRAAGAIGSVQGRIHPLINRGEWIRRLRSHLAGGHGAGRALHAVLQHRSRLGVSRVTFLSRSGPSATGALHIRHAVRPERSRRYIGGFGGRYFRVDER